MTASPRERFRAVLAGSRCVAPASVFDPTSARIAEDLGFEIGMLSGSVASLTVLGAPDLVVLTLPEFAAQARRICRAAALPLLVDADHGYGNALSVMRTVEELETAGVSAMTVEDTALPARYGQTGSVQLLSVEEGVGKMRAALAARRDPDLVVAGRTSAISVSGLEELIVRARAYEEAGVDALFLVGLQSPAQLDAVAAAVKLPLMLAGTGPDLAGFDLLGRLGVKVCVQGHLPVAAAIRAVHDTLKALRDGASPEAIPGIAAPELIRRVTRDENYRGWIRDFLGG